MRRHNLGLKSERLTPEFLAGLHAVLIITDHTAVDYSQVVRHAPLVVDTRNACERKGIRAPNVVKA